MTSSSEMSEGHDAYCNFRTFTRSYGRIHSKAEVRIGLSNPYAFFFLFFFFFEIRERKKERYDSRVKKIKLLGKKEAPSLFLCYGIHVTYACKSIQTSRTLRNTFSSVSALRRPLLLNTGITVLLRTFYFLLKVIWRGSHFGSAAFLRRWSLFALLSLSITGSI